MGNISKIATLIALITLAFGISAIDVAMAGSKLKAGTIKVTPPKEVMVIRIYNNGTAEVELGLGPNLISTEVMVGAYADAQGNPDLSRAQPNAQDIVLKDITARIIWSNPCTWLDLDGVWYYVCY